MARVLGRDVKFSVAQIPPELDADFDVLYQSFSVKSLSLLRSQNQATGSARSTTKERFSDVQAKPIVRFRVR